MTTYGFIGCGNMGGALARALAKNVDPASIYVSNRTAAKAQALADELGAHFATVTEVAATCTTIILGVKPQNLPELFAEIAPVLQARETPECSVTDDCDSADTCPDRYTLVAMAAGVPIARIRELAGERCAVIRIMPNLPASVGEGVTLYTSDGVGTKIRRFLRAFSAAGQFVEVPEDAFDAGMAISGCAPAFAFMFADALAKGGVACGLSHEVALALAAQTLRGSAALMQADSRSPEELTRAVCSPGGTTIEGVEALRAGNFDALVQSAVRASFEKAKRM